MEYKFVRIKDKKLNTLYPWMYYCDNFEGLWKHMNAFSSPYMKEAIIDYFKTRMGLKHATNYLAGLFVEKNIWFGKGLVEMVTDISDTEVNIKIKNIEKYGHILLRESPSFMFLTPDFEVVDEMYIESEDGSFPPYPVKDYTENDIVLSQWGIQFNGRHWYAKVGTNEVHEYVDDEYINKWNTREEAFEAGRRFLEELNSKYEKVY